MKLLLVIAHPLENSFTMAVAANARDALVANGHQVDWLDLYAEDFDPRLSAAERRSYFDDGGRLLELADNLHPASRFAYRMALRR